jgi:hypothetical protein
MVGIRGISLTRYFFTMILTFITLFVSLASSLTYLTGSFHPSFVEEYAGGLLMVLQKQDGGISRILCGEIWRCLTRRLSAMRRLSYLLLLMITLFKQQVFEMVSRITRRFSQFSKITLIHRIIKIDISNTFNSTCRTLTLDVLSGLTSRDYACGLKHGDAIPTCENLSNLFVQNIF